MKRILMVTPKLLRSLRMMKVNCELFFKAANLVASM